MKFKGSIGLIGIATLTFVAATFPLSASAGSFDIAMVDSCDPSAPLAVVGSACAASDEDDHAEHGDAHEHGGDEHESGHADDEAHDDHGDHAEHEGHDDHHDESRVKIAPEAVNAAGIGIEVVRPAVVRSTLRVTGRIAPNEDRMAHMIPRFPGVVKEVRKRLGDRVEQGDVLAVVQSNESLELYEIRSQIAGTVIKKHVTPGEFVAEDEDVYVVADLGSVWVDLNVYRQDFAGLALGQKVRLDAGEGIPPAESTIGYISPFGAPSTQTMLARVELPNPDGAWRPGLFVTGDVVLDERRAERAVKVAALQTLEGRAVVFVREGDAFEARQVTVGRRDHELAEILSGLEGGESYAAANSFVLKAELGKGSAAHDH